MYIIRFRQKGYIDRLELNGYILFRVGKISIAKRYSRFRRLYIRYVRANFVELIRSVISIPDKIVRLILAVLGFIPVVYVEREEKCEQ